VVSWCLCSIKYYVESKVFHVTKECDKFPIPQRNFLFTLLLRFNKAILGDDQTLFVENMCFIEDVHVIITSIVGGMLTIYRSTYGECLDLPPLLAITTCNPEHACGFIPTDIVCICMFIPVVSEIVFKGASLNAKLISVGIVVSMILYAIVITSAWASIFLIVMCLPFVLLMMHELRRQSIELFKLTESLHQSIEDNEKMAEELRLSEMKVMIGNVAHDLKTVREINKK
jgi:hypothetical protein